MKRERDAPGRIELRIRLVDGSFDSAVELPVAASAAARDAVVLAWFSLIQRALALAQEVPHARD